MRNGFLFPILLILAFAVSCTSRHKTTDTETALNRVVNKNLLGRVNRKGFETRPFDAWFSKNYKDYQLKKKEAKPLKELLKDVRIIVVMATWCPDSRREVPRLYKILDAAEFDEKNLTVYAVDRTKKTPGGETDRLNIQRVPTIIVIKDGKELGRIIEYPVYSLEKDLVMILSGENYKPNYSS